MLGETFGSWKIVRQLGEGGMGVVYLAEHALIGKRAAIKVLLPEFSHHQEVVNRFFNEARATTQINHIGLVEIFDFGYHANGSAYLVMEYLEGESLAAAAQRQRIFATPFIETVTRQIASAVGAAHAKGIVHRDLKPDNVFLLADRNAPEGFRIKVLDFGIAKLSGDVSSSVKTRAGSVLGTPSYMSPEQCRGISSIDHRADIYSLGCIMYELTTGRVPFVGEGAGDVMAAHIGTPVEPPSRLNPQIDPSLELLVLQMLQKKPEARPQSLDEVSQRLGQPAASARVSASPTQPTIVPAASSSAVQSTAASSAGQVVSSPAIRRARWPLRIALAGFVAIAAVVAIAIATAKHDGTTAAPGAAPAPVADVRPPSAKPKHHAALKFDDITPIAAPADSPSTAERPAQSAAAAARPAAATANADRDGDGDDGSDAEGSDGFDLPAFSPDADHPGAGIGALVNNFLFRAETKLVKTLGPHRDPSVVLQVESDPPGADVTYDGVSSAKTPMRVTTRPSKELLRLVIHKDNYVDKAVELPTDDDNLVLVRLEKVPVKIQLTITSEPVGADVVYNGETIGKTPVTVDAIEDDVKTAVFALSLHGYKPKELDVPLKATVTTSARLIPDCPNAKQHEDTGPHLIDPYNPCRVR